MKLSTVEQPAADLSGVTSKAFGFEMNAKMYDIVVSKLYKDKHGAIIRELCCNAYDSHVAAGCPDRPFELHLPSWLDKTFYIRDFGTGIDHEEFEDIYTNVGKSTKEDSNDFIGAYGLGCKTPFTLSDTYIIENIQGGRKTTWACFKSEGVPQVSKVDDRATTEHDGLKVTISFSSDHTDDFKRAAVKQLQFFDVKPTLTGSSVEWKQIEKFPPGVNYRYLDGLTSSYVVMGNVCYPFSSRDIYDDTLELVTSRPLAIRATLGDVDVPPSRETLEFTDKTKNFLRTIAKQIKQEYLKDLRKETEKIPNLWELSIWWNKGEFNSKLMAGDDVIYYNQGNSQITKEELSTTKALSLRFPEFRTLCARHYRGYGVNAKVSYRQEEIYSFRISPALRFYVDDLGTGARKYLSEKAQADPNTFDNNAFVLRPTKAINKDKIRKECVEVRDAVVKLGAPCKLLSDVIGYPPKVARGTKAAGKAEPNQVFSAQRGTQVQRALKEEEDIPTSGYALELKGYRVVIDKKELSRELTLQLINSVASLDADVYFVRSKTYAKLSITKGAKTVEMLKRKLHKTLKDRVVRSLLEDGEYYSIGRSLSVIKEHCPKAFPKEGEVLLRYLKTIRLRSASYTQTYFGRDVAHLANTYARLNGDTYASWDSFKEEAEEHLEKVNALVNKALSTSGPLVEWIASLGQSCWTSGSKTPAALQFINDNWK